MAERLNRTLIESVQSMLTDAQLPHKFWTEALSTAFFVLRNRSSTSTVFGMTPFQPWSGKNPSMNNLKVFEFAASSHIPKDETKKLDLKARRCIFLGYGDVTKRYRLYDLIKARMIHSRDVVFDETSLGFEKEQMKDLEGVNKPVLDVSTEEPYSESDEEQAVTEDRTNPVQPDEESSTVLRRSE